MSNNTRSVLVVGLGRFGSSVATTLDMMGQDVLAVDKDGELVNRWSSQIPTVQADMTDVMALEQINASDFDTAVVAIGDSVEASVITAGNLLDAGISDIWAKSVSKEHARILQRIGARHIINAETDASITPELDAEAARVVKSMPKWKPATVKDKAVRCRYTVPVTFKLQ